MVVVGNFTNDAQQYLVYFHETPGIWYNYMNGETLSVPVSGTLDIPIPANDFRVYTNFK
jgi:hypothetical protein